MNTITVPPPLVEPTELTSDWFTSALRHAGRLDTASVVGITATPIGTGQVADTLLFRLTYDYPEGAAPQALIAKIAAADPNSRAGAVGQRLYEREVRFYQTLQSRTNVTTPRHIYSDIDPATGSFILLLEDLSPAASVNQLAGFNTEHARRAMDEAAALHAPLWGEVTLDELAWLNHTRTNGMAIAQTAPTLTEAFCERYADSLAADDVAAIRRLNAYTALFWTQQRGPLTVIHGDFRPDNMLFDAKDGEVPLAVLDWQTIDHGNGLLDVAFVLGTALDPGLRREQEHELVRRYFDALVAGGVQGYDWPQCWDDYCFHACYGLYFLTVAAMMVERTKRGDAMFLTMIRRVLTQIADLGTEALLRDSDRTGDADTI